MKKILHRALIGLFGLTIAFALLLLSAPYLLDALVLPRLLARAGLPEESVAILRMTPFGLQGSVELTGDERPLLTIPRLEIGYTPGSLLNRRLTRLVLDHATLHLELRDGRPVLPGTPEEQPKNFNDTGMLLLSPLMVDELILTSCSLILHQSGQPDLRVNLSARSSQRFSPAGEEGYRLTSLLGTFILSEALSGAGSLSLATEDRYEAVLTLRDCRLTFVDRLLPGLDSSMFGSLSLQSTLTLAPGIFDFEHVAGTGSFSRFHLVLAGFEGGGTGPDEMLEFSFAGPPEKLDYKVSGLRLARPVSLSAALSGSAAFPGDGPVRIDGAIDALLGGVPHTGDENGINILGTYGAVFSTEQLAADLSLLSRPPPLGDPESQVRVAKGVTAAAHLVHRNGVIKATISGIIPELSLPSEELLLSNIALKLPVELPAPATPPEPGSFSIGAISRRETKLLSLSSSITQQGEAFAVKGFARALFDPKLKAAFSGSAQPFEQRAEISWSLPDTSLSSTSLPSGLGISEAISFDTRLAAQGTFDYDTRGFAGTAQGRISRATLGLSESGLLIDGLDCALKLPRLPNPVSSPSQRCTAAAIDVGKLHFSDAAVTFRIEDRETLFIEESRASWSQGTVEFGSLRLSARDRAIDTTLYCNGINLAELLNQFGLDQTEGQGALNGRLPVHLSAKGLRFDQGFLFSTPGTGGILRFTETDMLRQGMADVGEAGYLDYSLKALEDFAYDWTRLSFDTEGENLLLSMNLEGKPREPLPFGFKDGRIVETGKGQGLQHPVRLDINFRLPLNQLFQIGQSIQSLMENK